ncbi:Helix-hairpin-helix motif-containing protein [Hymenobacter daecheongensis DSM 21074]|uniref:Helix-hairpin-helix motif-containing protein n=1 Tax=Hymenobacter daecheongensis DSM 21074 TaxID=1121955 RepID=A0A1M6GKE3_9BACT|nr:helix-hairpin-helix domain-containing protein [Hymenobacter daecheongensis]SHJ10390.1 Helix-hairpin-helix motif-containing protein [Hymenobacter daecheongensis DSM 21074]
MKRRYLLALPLLWLLAAPRARAQEYVRPAADLDRLVQELFAEIQSDQVPYEDLYETLLQYYQTPLNLNTASREELRGLLLLSEAQISNLLDHRQQRGSLISLYELQSVAGFDLRTIYRVAPFVAVQTNASGSRGSLWQRIAREENNALFVRYERVVQQRQGYTPTDSTRSGGLSSRYLGSPDKLMVRYRVSHARDFSLGLTAEKDAGEQFAWNPAQRRYGADFYSAHFLLQERGRLKTLALGDYQLQFGQGLLLSSGLQVGKGAETITTIRRSSLGVRAYSSLLESTFFRGAAATVALAPTIRATAFVSRKRADANVQSATDSLAQFDEFSSGVLLTGFHRTASELANRQVLRETIGGGNVSYVSRSGHFSAGLTAVNTHFDKPLQRQPELYNRYEFRGRDNLGVGAHYSYVVRNLLLFGETARSTGGGLGTVNGVLASLATNVDASLLYRHYSPDFHTLYGNALSENTRNINESGLYAGLKVRPIARWELSAYYDQFWFPWLKYQVSAPSQGHDWLVRLAFTPSKTSLLYAQLRTRVKEYDASPADPGRLVPLPVPTTRQSLLLFYDTSPTLALSLRTRLQGTRYREDGGPLRTGYVLAQDASVALGRALKLSGRYALFDTDDYDTRQYVFEQDVLYAFSIPALSGQGTRLYAIAEVKCTRHLTLWLRYAETHYRHQQTIGSGLEEIQGPRRGEVKAQARYRF